MTRLLLCTCVVALTATIGCGGSGSSKPAACVSTNDPAVVAAARAHVHDVVVGESAKAADATKTTAAKGIDIAACLTSDTAGRATVTVLGIHDPTIRDVRHQLVLGQQDKTWTILRDGDSYRCKRGHGQQDFEPKRCS
jgi:hypothetical protein